MKRVPGMVMIGAASRNVGKTELACDLSSRFSKQHQVIAIKVTAVDRNDGLCPRGGKGCGVCSSLDCDFAITEETQGPPGKDTTRLLKAGAHRVFWLRSLKTHLAKGFGVLLDSLPQDALLVVESTSLRNHVDPDLFILARDPGITTIKQSAQGVLHLADRVLFFSGHGFDFDTDRIDLVEHQWVIREPATAIVLAGGKSRRMGTDKSMLNQGGKPMIQHIIEQLRPHFNELIVSANDIERYSFLGVPVVPDLVPDQGPLRGIASALEKSNNELNFVVACDIPQINIRMARRLLSLAADCDGAMPMTGDSHYEPLFAVYHKSLAPSAVELLDEGERRIAALYSRFNFKYLRTSSVQAASIKNLNSIKDFEHFSHAEGQTTNNKLHQGP